MPTFTVNIPGGRNLVTAFVASLALTAQATAAVVLITQNKAVNDGIGPGDTKGFPITISQPGAYRLDTNLTVPANTNGIQVNAPDVTIDLGASG